jgi:putative chitinase
LAVWSRIVNRKKYYSYLGQHTQEQVNGQEAILNEAAKRGASLTLTAYALATARHETGGTFGPVTENLNYTTPERIRQVWPKRFPTVDSARPYVKNPRALAGTVYGDRKDLGNTGALDGWHFRGRGLAQITGRANYAKWGLESKPDDALKLPVAARILLDGLEKGMFTGKKVGDYGTYKPMRATVNADGALNGATVAGHAERYEAALRAAGYGKGLPATLPEIIASAPVAVGAATGDWLPWLVLAGVLLAGVIAYRIIRK